MERAARRHRSPYTWARAFVEIALIGVVAIGLGGIVLGRVLPALGHPVFVVAGPSMTPTIDVGSAVILDPVTPADLEVRDVVSLRSGDGRATFTHRIVRLAERGGAIWIETKGDANATPDPSITPATAVVGRVSLALPGAGYLLTLLSAPVGVLLVLSTGATLMVLSWFLESLEFERRRRRSVVDQPVVLAERAGIAAPAGRLALAGTDPALSAAATVAVASASVVAPAPPTKPRTQRTERRKPRLTDDAVTMQRQRLSRARAVGRGT